MGAPETIDAVEVTALPRHTIKVLLVDDQAIIGEAIRRMLVPEKDIVFQFCNDPTAALHVANKFAPTVILQDLVMPDIDGLMLVRFFRANAATRDIPLIVLSTKEEPKIKAEAFALGANDYLVKLPDKPNCSPASATTPKGISVSWNATMPTEHWSRWPRSCSSTTASFARPLDAISRMTW
jgi:PleD family two-component response regulator